MIYVIHTMTSSIVQIYKRVYQYICIDYEGT